jgi:hypothetical protein
VSFLRDLDEKYVPRAAEALDRLVRKFPKGPEPAGPLPVILRLRRWDDRWTAAGPLATLREVPQLGAVVIGALVLTGSITVRLRTDAAERERRPEASASPSPGTAASAPTDGPLGPQIGDNVRTYVSDTAKRLRALAPGTPDGMVVAVVSFSAYQTPEQVRDLVGPLQVRQIFFRAPVPLPQGLVHTAAVEDVVTDSKREFRQVARLRAAEARELRKVAATIENDPAQKSEHLKDAALADREVKVLRGRCACVYGVVVRARLRLLVDLLNLGDIRTIDVSAVNALIEDFTFTALLPEERRVVTGGNQEA